LSPTYDWEENCKNKSGDVFTFHDLKVVGKKLICARCGFEYPKPLLKNFISSEPIELDGKTINVGTIDFASYAFALEEYIRRMEGALQKNIPIERLVA
jgi:hypothetical protein